MDPTHWGVFGDFLNPFIGILNITVVAYLAFLVNHYQRSEDKKALREWNSEIMYTARTNGYDTLKKLPFISLKDLDRLHSKELVHVWIVIGFFQRLEILRSHTQVTEPSVSNMFGQIFTWWDINCFKCQLPDSWESFQHINSLRESIKTFASQDEVERWVRAAEADLKERDTAQPAAQPDSLQLAG